MMQLRSAADDKGDFENHHTVHKFQTENALLLVIREDAWNPFYFFANNKKC